MGNSTLKTLLGTPATNDRCANAHKNELFGRLKVLLVEFNKDKEDSPGYLDWRKIDEDDYQESLTPRQGNKDNFNPHTKERDDSDADDDSYLSHSSSTWNAIYADDLDIF